MTYVAQLSTANGEGRLVRRPDALLFLPAPAGENALPDGDSALIDAFLDAPADEVDEVLAEHVLSRTDTAPAFVAVSWPQGSSAERLKVAVRGAAELSSDIASMPALSGAGSSTWVEHRVVRNPPAASLRSGATATVDTDFRGGVISAGGFHLSLERTGTRVDSAAPQAAPPHDAPARTAETAETAETDKTSETAETLETSKTSDPEATITAVEVLDQFDEVGQPAPDTGTDTDTGTGTDTDTDTDTVTEVADTDASTTEPGDAISALESAAGSDWMEESLQLDTRHVAAVATHLHPEADPSTPPPDAPTPPPHGRSNSEELRPATPRPPGPPVFPGDDEHSISNAQPAPGPVSSNRPAPSLDRLVSARLCTSGHANSPHDANCRLCGSVLDPDQATTTVDQPTLALIRLSDGSSVAVSGDVVLGRNPSNTAARLDGATLVTLDAPSSVSRTHLSISVDGWRLLVTDCGSRAGSALVVDGEDEPIPLEAWMPHEINGGDRLFLGGPTAVTIDEVPSP